MLLQRPSIQKLFSGYEYYPFGGGQPIPAPLLRKPKEKQQLDRIEKSQSAKVSARKQLEIGEPQVQKPQAAGVAEKRYNGSVIRNHDQSLVLDNLNGPPLKAANP